MISLITSTKSRSTLAAFEANVEATVGVPYELIVIENPTGAFGIAEAYNRGADRARYGVLCFLHDDIFFHTPDWGRRVLELLAEPSVGVLGVAGAIALSGIPGDWANSPFVEAQLIQQFKRLERPCQHIHINYSGHNPAQVSVLDGLWFCVRKDVYLQHRFDPVTFPGFHGYDLDYSFAVAQTHKNLVTFDILIEHYSEGHFGREWLDSAFKMVRKWDEALPFAFQPQRASFWRSLKRSSSKSTIKHMIRSGFSRGQIAAELVQFHLLSTFAPLRYIQSMAQAAKYHNRFNSQDKTI